ncbi:beta and beta-prime subunits of DNA dependent RNA-polymerase [Coniophora puteana RWD-64-598 SS2]|uniref:DNA-directed RNA polymerase subunit n=1 Tax=Coniophora puteana (strain RWD-64-598) TaxID=741705 RepID=A0A5M3MSQ8_CONPW|nr:beta and beta-prime subunits of DNA dependent RNA-polymerase [Coniophora puteana RWD-64-598 SS2]EIW82067.1 beta and beta-prime subunits of DNA dependent RNA-polymerase [Coniophora puteana RWD-64-598 SS2]
MNIAHSIPSTVSSVSFSFLTSQDIRRISVKQIVNPVLLDDLNRPNIGGLYDPALGPSERQDICATCRLSYFTCPGHFGHIELPLPVFHPLFMVNAYNILRATCLFCHKFKLPRTVLCKYAAKLRLLEHGLLEAAHGIDDIRLIQRKEKGDDAEDDGGSDETAQEFEMRVNLYVSIYLSRASSSRRDHYKDGLVYQARKDIISDFMRTAMIRQCKNCGAHGFTFRKEGHTKVIEYDLTPKQKSQHAYSGLKRPRVLDLAPVPNHSDINHMDVDSASSESEGEGEPILSEDNDEPPNVAKPSEDHQARAVNGKIKGKRGRNERLMPPEECRAHIRRLFKNESTLCSLLYGRHGPFAPLTPTGLSLASADMFFMEVVPVPPTRFRPPVRMGETLFEHQQNELLSKVLNSSYRVRDANANVRAKDATKDQSRAEEYLWDSVVQMQIDVNSFIDSNKNPAPVRQGKLPPAGVKQGLEKKEGLFRKHMMGKRVNYAARSVISPDVNIEPNEIGIPPVFARKLTYPEPVTPINFHELRQYVIAGPKNYPGATMVEYEDGHQQSLENMTIEQRTAIANQLLTPYNGSDNRRGLATKTASVNKKVYRHLLNGDILILNRQPTLHKPSMMCHKARILRGEKTIRMHYANCNSYNADFDGDEMNIHFPQNQVARAEAMLIANTDNQYLVPTSGKPLRGLIQDHVVAGVWMTCQDAFFTREEYFQLLYGALRPEDQIDQVGRLKTLPPTIWKPAPRWTGKQIISTVLKNITPTNAEGLNLESKAKVPGNLWGKGSTEDNVIFVDGDLVSGVLDKSAFGATDYGLVHSVYELYGADVAGKLLGILSRLFTKFLQHRAFTCRMDDLALTPDADKRRSDILDDACNFGTDAAIENFPSLVGLDKEDVPQALASLLRDILRDDNKMAGLDVTVRNKMGGLTKSVEDACVPGGLLRKFPYNHMQMMTLSGAKGSAVNARQISCGLGQQELEGRRVPLMVSGKSLPSFKALETKAIAGGYVASRFLTGIKPQEFYFHCMAGREGLIDTAVKTSRSGYLQRCLIKHLEGLRVHYDHTVRGSDMSIYQFHYGGDGLDVTKQKHLYQFGFVAQNEKSFVNRLQPAEVAQAINEEDAIAYMKKVLKKSAEREDKHTPAPREVYDPALNKFTPSRYLGSTSEKFASALDSYTKTNPHNLLRSKKLHHPLPIKKRKDNMSVNHFKMLMNVKYMRSLADPGEAVGLLASQGVGEPSTQMTLNTFHFAGHGAANVTLGIPRLREIVMTASQKPKTPSMTMEARADTSQGEVSAFCKQANRMTLAQVVEKITVRERLTASGDAHRTEFIVDMEFFPEEEYRSEYDVEPSEILAVFSSKFPLFLKKEIQNEIKKIDADLKSQIAELGKGKVSKDLPVDGGDAEDEAAPPSRGRDDDERSEEGDGDAEDEKRARQRKQQATYDSDEDEDPTELDEDAIEAAFATASNDDEERAEIPKLSKSLKERIKVVSDLFQHNLIFATSFDFTTKKCTFKLEFTAEFPKLLLVGVVERTCHKSIIREIPGIADCFSSAKDNDQKGKKKIQVTTNGSNLQGMWLFNDQDVIVNDTIYSNDIYAILKTYGVEMARAAILREIGGVFSAYKIDVDMRHLELIADYMTFEGGYKPFNRSGLSSNPSPLLKASYETTAAFLSDATLYGDFDDLSTPSGNIVMGRPNRTGTGVFDVVMPIA